MFINAKFIIMKKSVVYALIIGCLSLFISLALKGQSYGNEWIDFTQSYYKIKVAEEGVYRINYEVLDGLGLPNNPNGYQLYRNGKEVPLYISGNGNSLNPNDFLTFIGRANDGEFDTQLYRKAIDQLHNYKSLFTDTAVYYLTWKTPNPDAGDYENLRVTDAFNEAVNVAATATPEAFFMHESLQVYANTHFSGKGYKLGSINANFADFEAGEGFVGNTILHGDERTLNFATKGIYNGENAPLGKLEIKVVGRSNDPDTLADHHLKVQVNDSTVIDHIYADFEAKRLRANLPITALSEGATPIRISSEGDTSTDDKFSMVYLKVNYPHRFDFDNANYFRFKIRNGGSKYLEIENFDTSSGGVVLYDITHGIRIKGWVQNGKVRFSLPQGRVCDMERELVLANIGTGTTSINDLEAVQFPNYKEQANAGNYLIISHPLLMQGDTNWVQQYADYRASAQGGNYQVQVANVYDLYDQFAYGNVLHPLAIRNFINYAIDHFETAPEYVLLLGKSISYNQMYPLIFNQCLVPTFGQNPSDNMLAVRNIKGYIPQLAIGRVPAKNEADVNAYLQKIIQHETALNINSCDKADRLWLKSVVQLAQGNDSIQAGYFKGYLKDYEQIFGNPSWGGGVDYTHILSAYGVNAPPSNFTTKMNDGISLLNYFGHGFGNSWALNLQSPQTYNNAGKYPFILSASCLTGNLHNTGNSSSMSETYTMANQRGAIGFLSSTSIGIASFIHSFQKSFFNNFNQTYYGQPLGVIMRQAIEDEYIEDETQFIAMGTRYTCQSLTLAGDPAIRLYTPNEADYLIEREDVVLKTNDDNILLGDTITLANNIDSLDLEVTAYNLGKALLGNIHINMYLTLPDGSTLWRYSKTQNAPFFADTFAFKLPLNPRISGLHKLVIEIDDLNQVNESCEENNNITVWMQRGHLNCNNLPVPSIEVDGPGYFCLESPPENLVATVAGGNFYGAAVVDNSFDASLVEPGLNVVAYSYYDATTGCTVGTARSIPVIEPPVAQLVGDTIYCAGASTPLNTTDVYSSYQWSNGATTPQANANEVGLYTVTVTSLEGCLGLSDTIEMHVSDPQIALAEDLSFCPGKSVLVNTNKNYMNYYWSDGKLGPAIKISEEGMYNVTVTNYDNCTVVSDSVWIAEAEGPTVTLPDVLEVTAGEFPIELIPESSTPNLLYEWHDGTLESFFTADVTGIYTVTVTAENGCTAAATSVLNHPLNTAVETPTTGEQQEIVKAFPSPFKEQLQLNVYPKNINGAIELLDVLGKKVLEITVEPSETQSNVAINTEVLPTGVYFLKWESVSGENRLLKIMKQN